MNRILGCYTPIPMGAFYTVAQLLLDDAEKLTVVFLLLARHSLSELRLCSCFVRRFCAWCLSDFRWKDEKTPKTTHFSGQDLECTGETIMMAPAAGFYASTSSATDSTTVSEQGRTTATDSTSSATDSTSSATDSTTVSEQGRTTATGTRLGHDQVRLAYVLCKEDIQRALMILEKAIEAYNKLDNHG